MCLEFFPSLKKGRCFYKSKIKMKKEVKKMWIEPAKDFTDYKVKKDLIKFIQKKCEEKVDITDQNIWNSRLAQADEA